MTPQEITPEGSVAPVFVTGEPGPPPVGSEVLQAESAVLRQMAYQDEADPLFFKWQRGEATEQEWLDSIEEIRQRYPYPEEEES